MNRALILSPRRYTLRDAAVISFRCAPVAAFFYGFLDLVSAALTPIKTLAVARFIDAAIESVQIGAPTRGVYLSLASIAALTAYQWLKAALHNFADLRLVLALRERYRTALTEKRTRLAYHHIENAETWDLIQRVAHNPEGGRLKASYFHMIDLASFIVKVGGLLTILTTAIWWGGPAILAVSALTLITGIRGGRLHYQAERQVSGYDRRTDYFSKLLLGRDAAAERILFGFTPWITTKWREAFDTGLRVRIKTRIKWYISAYTGNLITLLSWIFIMVILLKPLQTGAISVGLFIALTQSFTSLNIVWGFMETVHGLAADSEFFRDLTKFLRLEEYNSTDDGTKPESDDHEYAASIRPVGSLRNSILKEHSFRSPFSSLFSSLELRDVSFRYPGTDRWILDDLSFIFEPGVHYALVGANGAGKTTLTRLITRLYPPDSGVILLDGTDIRTLRYSDLLSYFALVYQDFARYNLSFRDNILVGSDGRYSPAGDTAAGFGEPDDGGWDRLMTDTGLRSIVERLSNGPDTLLGKLHKDGIDLSGGEWQRVAMARALAGAAPILILDEPTASMDPVAESDLYRLFDRAASGRTTLFISHRLGATKIADTILVLERGRIAEAGTHAELMDQKGLYREMFDSQRSWYDAD